MDGTTGNCPNFSYADTNQLNTANIVGSSISFVATFATIALVLVTKSYRVFVHRLTAYLAVPGFLFSFALLLHIGAIRVSGDLVTYDKDFCTATGFFVQYITWVEAVIAFWINVYVFELTFLKVQLTRRRYEVAGIVLSISLPLFLSWEPMVQNVYGPAGAWCWIKVGGDNCTTDGGLSYQISLYYGPLLLLSILNIVEVLGVTAKLCVGAYRTEGSLQRYHITAIKEVVPIFIYPAIFFLTFLFGLCHRVTSALLLINGKRQSMPMWVTFVLLVTTRGLYLPVAFVLHPHIRTRLKCHKRTNSDTPIAGPTNNHHSSFGTTHQFTGTGIYTTQTHYVVPKQSIGSHTPLIIKSDT
eukprot:Em0010g362a